MGVFFFLLLFYADFCENTQNTTIMYSFGTNWEFYYYHVQF